MSVGDRSIRERAVDVVLARRSPCCPAVMDETDIFYILRSCPGSSLGRSTEMMVAASVRRQQFCFCGRIGFGKVLHWEEACEREWRCVGVSE